MKRTTYLFIGFLTGLFLLTLAFILLIAVDRDEHSGRGRILHLDGTSVSLPLPACPYISLSDSFTESEEADPVVRPYYGGIRLHLRRDSLREEGYLTLPAALQGGLTLRRQEDTLFIHIDYTRADVQALLRTQAANPSQRRAYYLSASEGIGLQLPAATHTVHHRIHSMRLQVEDCGGDSLAVQCVLPVRVAGCRLHALRVESRQIDIHSGHIEHLHLDLDQTTYWSVNADSARIGTEYLSGSSYHRNTLSRKECRRVVWTPRTPEATLALTLREAAEVRVQEGE